jgi:hypothetical protein
MRQGGGADRSRPAGGWPVGAAPALLLLCLASKRANRSPLGCGAGATAFGQFDARLCFPQEAIEPRQHSIILFYQYDVPVPGGLDRSANRRDGREK